MATSPELHQHAVRPPCGGLSTAAGGVDPGARGVETGVPGRKNGAS